MFWTLFCCDVSRDIGHKLLLAQKWLSSIKIGDTRVELLAGQINPKLLGNKAAPFYQKNVFPLPNYSSTQTSIILSAGFSATDTPNCYYFYHVKSWFIFSHAALTQRQPTQFCPIFQTIMQLQKMSTDSIFKWHSKTCKPLSMLQDKWVPSYTTARVVPDCPIVCRFPALALNLRVQQP